MALRIHRTAAAWGVSILIAAAGGCGCDRQQEATAMSDAPAKNAGPNQPAAPAGAKPAVTETATFGAGCFWGVEATFRKIPGVVDAAVGYSGGTKDNPTYKDVCTDRTGHAEVIQVTYDPAKVGYDKLLEVFWACHNPTTLNRQGPDVGTQYRSAIFYHTPEQKVAAEASKAKLSESGRFGDPVVTEIAPAAPFWRAEEYHQRYLEKRGIDACHNP